MWLDTNMNRTASAPQGTHEPTHTRRRAGRQAGSPAEHPQTPQAPGAVHFSLLFLVVFAVSLSCSSSCPTSATSPLPFVLLHRLCLALSFSLSLCQAKSPLAVCGPCPSFHKDGEGGTCSRAFLCGAPCVRATRRQFFLVVRSSSRLPQPTRCAIHTSVAFAAAQISGPLSNTPAASATSVAVGEPQAVELHKNKSGGTPLPK